MFIHLKIIFIFIFNLNIIITNENNNNNKENIKEKNNKLIILYNKILKINEIGKYNKKQKQIIFVYESLNKKYPEKLKNINEKNNLNEKLNKFSKRLKSSLCFEGLY